MNDGVVDGLHHPLATTGQLLASVAHNPATSANSQTSSSTFAAVNTNLVATFIVPASGSVLVHLSATCDQSSASAYGFWRLHDGVAAVTGSEAYVVQGTAVEHPTQLIRVADLIPGSTQVWTWQFRTSGGGTHTIYFGQSGFHGGAVMEVWAA